MNTQEIVTQLKPVFEKVAEKIGQGAEFGWGVVLRQQYVEATMGLLFAVIGAILTKYIFIPWVGKLTHEDYSKRWDDAGWVGFGLTVWIPLAMILFGLETAITHFINPEFYALQFFMGLVK